mgnify:CR=1 FL=1
MPKCGGKIIERRTRRGVVFYGCENYPQCDYVSWDMPLTSNCKTCGSFLFRHRFKMEELFYIAVMMIVLQEKKILL